MGGLGAMAYAARHPASSARRRRSPAWCTRSATPRSARPDRGLHADAATVWGDPPRPRVVAAHDPTALAGARGHPLFVASGDGPGRATRATRSRPTVGAETRAFVRRGSALRVPVRTDLYGPGTHDWPYWQRELHRALPTLLGVAARAQAPRMRSARWPAFFALSSPTPATGHARRHLDDRQQRVEAAASPTGGWRAARR